MRRGDWTRATSVRGAARRPIGRVAARARPRLRPAGPGPSLADVELLRRSRGRARSSPSAATIASTRPKRARAPVDPVLFTKYPSSPSRDRARDRWRAATRQRWTTRRSSAWSSAGRARRHREGALDSVLGYTCLNDVSARDMQFGDGQWVRAQEPRHVLPDGPVDRDPDEVPDPRALRSGAPSTARSLQDAWTADLIHGVAELIAFCSRFFTLEPGDVYRDRDSGRRGRVPQAARVPRGWRRGRHRHRGGRGAHQPLPYSSRLSRATIRACPTS